MCFSEKTLDNLHQLTVNALNKIGAPVAALTHPSEGVRAVCHREP